MQGVGFLSLISQTLATDLYRLHFSSGFSHLSRSCKSRTHPIHCLVGSRRGGLCSTWRFTAGGLWQYHQTAEELLIETVLRTSYAKCMYFQGCLCSWMAIHRRKMLGAMLVCISQLNFIWKGSCC